MMSRWFRRLGFKIPLYSLIIGLLPMLLVSFLSYFKARDSMTRSSIEFYVTRVARDTALRLNNIISRMERETLFLARSPYLTHLLEDYFAQPNVLDQKRIQAEIQAELNHGVRTLKDIDMVVITDPSGAVLVTSNVKRTEPELSFVMPVETDASGQRFSGERLNSRPWWPKTGSEGASFVDFGREPLVQQSYGRRIYLDENTSASEIERVKNPAAFNFGWTCHIPSPAAADLPLANRFQGVLVVFYNWTAVQNMLDGVNDDFVLRHPLYASGYTFLFQSDADTIIAHKHRINYLSELRRHHHLDSLHDVMVQAKDEDLTHEYFYQEPKISGISRVEKAGWYLGFGINKTDIFKEVNELRRLMLIVGLISFGLILIFVALFSRRITEPLRRLTEATDRIAKGDLDSRISLGNYDEIDVLGDAFNTMAENLKVSNSQLIEAQKSKAWQEMARQVAHEIKNPLTPMKLTAQLIQRARQDRHPDFDKILEESVSNIVSQIENLRRIAANFAAYGKFPSAEYKPVSIKDVLDQSVRHYADNNVVGARIVREDLVGGEVLVTIDADDMKRVFLNLFNNAFDAMPQGGELRISTVRLHHEQMGDVVRISVKDTGKGIRPEDMERLFTPYFTTHSSGTGLGLAIVKKLIENFGGSITIDSELNRGTNVVIYLPVAAAK